jgi:hypothetical protein
VGGGVAVAEDSVLASADDFVFVDYDGAYRDFAVGFGGVGFGYGGAEVVEVAIHLFHFSVDRFYGCYSRGVCYRPIGLLSQGERITTNRY